MPIWEPLFVAVSGGRRHERRRAMEALAAALVQHGIRAARLESSRETRAGKPAPFWDHDVVLVEGFAKTDLPQIVLGRPRTPGTAGRIVAFLDPSQTETGPAVEAVARQVEHLLKRRRDRQPSPPTP